VDVDERPRGLPMRLRRGWSSVVPHWVAGLWCVWQGNAEIVAILREHTQLLRSIDESLKAKMQL
jgi:hypothetical protein